jgi:hypothetical protein
VTQVAVTSWAVHVPGLSSVDVPGAPDEPAVPADQAHLVLGRKGLLAKEPATRLALCAVHEALRLPPGKLTEPVAGADRTAVVVASNLGNLATVCAVVDEMRESGSHAVSPLQAPNASSNVIASTIAIRYGFTGPNFLLCDGATAGLNAIRLGALLLRSGRADRAVVVGVEPGDDIARALVQRRTPTPGGPVELRDAAACVVLERGPGVVVGALTRHPRPPHTDADLVLGPYPNSAGASLTALVGDSYGALGVLQVAVAAARLTGAAPGALPGRADQPRDAVLTCGDPDDGYATLRLEHRVPVGVA